MKWINVDGKNVRIDEADDDLFKVWFHDAFEWLMPKFLRKATKGVLENPEASQTALTNFNKKTKKTQKDVAMMILQERNAVLERMFAATRIRRRITFIIMAGFFIVFLITLSVLT